MRELLQLPPDSAPAGSCLLVLDSQAGKVIEALLCKGEAAVPAGGVQGDGAFEKAYAATRRPDPRDRSLRDLDLRTRLLRYRCSPLIYARTFASMPKELRTVVLRRLSAGLLAATPAPEFAHLPADVPVPVDVARDELTTAGVAWEAATCWLVATGLFVATHAPTGNVWDAWLDPGLWLFAHYQWIRHGGFHRTRINHS
jgi:hypothetical protein